MAFILSFCGFLYIQELDLCCQHVIQGWATPPGYPKIQEDSNLSTEQPALRCPGPQPLQQVREAGIAISSECTGNPAAWYMTRNRNQLRRTTTRHWTNQAAFVPDNP